MQVEAEAASSEDGESSVSLLVRRMRAWVSGAAALTVRWGAAAVGGTPRQVDA